MDVKKEKEELIEMFGIHFEKLYNLPPLGSRILGILILDGCRDGITFESLVERLEASKSSVSTNLNLLLKLGKIKYYTISGDRKKYFKASPFSERLANYLRMLEFEKEIIDMMLSYREKTVSCPEERCSLENTKAYKAHVIEVEELLIKTIEKFKEIEKNK
jgi:DNA-binding transcriptional regulator GbsR (MarR family)